MEIDKCGYWKLIKKEDVNSFSGWIALEEIMKQTNRYMNTHASP